MTFRVPDKIFCLAKKDLGSSPRSCCVQISVSERAFKRSRLNEVLTFGLRCYILLIFPKFHRRLSFISCLLPFGDATATATTAAAAAAGQRLGSLAWELLRGGCASEELRPLAEQSLAVAAAVAASIVWLPFCD